MNEYVFQAGRFFVDTDSRSSAQRRDNRLQRVAVMPADMQRRAEEGDVFHAGFAFELRKQLADIAPSVAPPVPRKGIRLPKDHQITPRRIDSRYALTRD